MPTVREVSLCHSPTALCLLLHSYVEAINSGRLPCLEGAAAVMMANENAAAVAAALEAYAKGMRELTLPTEPAELSASHGKHLNEALTIFQRRSFRDRDQEHQRRLMVLGHPPWCHSTVPVLRPCSYPYNAVCVPMALSPLPQHFPSPGTLSPLTCPHSTVPIPTRLPLSS